VLKISFGALMLMVTTGACARTTPPPASGTAALDSNTATSAPARANRDVITQEELSVSSISGLTVLEAVRMLRPRFLTVRGLTTVPGQIPDEEAGKVHVSIDGNKIVALEELSGIRAGTVAEIRYLNAPAAMQKFGATAREGPVILVKTMK
jgi:hypothetical protein